VFHELAESIDERLTRFRLAGLDQARSVDFSEGFSARRHKRHAGAKNRIS
jgi:hypothetical protein